jgi:hypothetical protein
MPVVSVSHVTLSSLRAEVVRTLISTGDIMNISKSLIACAIAAGLVTGAYAVASSSKANANLAMYGVGAPMAWPERKALITTVVQKWAGYEQKVHGINAKVWARSMGGTFATVDPATFRRAAKMTTYEGMIATLLGQKTTDAKIIDSLARDSSPSALAALASPASGLVYTMIQPCRIIDTRVIASKMDPNEEYSYEASRPGGNFLDQGGSGTDCGMPADPAAVVMNVTVVDAEGSGFLTIWPYGTTRPLASSNNYSIGRNTGNEVIVRQTVGDLKDFGMFANRKVHVVADVTGYFSAPTPGSEGALDTTIANSVDNQVDPGETFTVTATCPAGYSVTGGGEKHSPSTSLATISESYPSDSGTGWTVTGLNTSVDSLVVHSRAICARD